MAIAGIVVDDRQVFWPQVNQRMDQFNRYARTTKTTNHERLAIRNIADCRRQIGNGLIH